MSTEQIAYLTKGLVGPDPKRVRLYQTSPTFKLWVDTQVEILIALAESMAFAATVIETATAAEIERIEREASPAMLVDLSTGKVTPVPEPEPTPVILLSECNLCGRPIRRDEERNWSHVDGFSEHHAREMPTRTQVER